MFENKLFNNMLSKNKNYYKNVSLLKYYENIINKFFEDEFIKNLIFQKWWRVVYMSWNHKKKIFH